MSYHTSVVGDAAKFVLGFALGSAVTWGIQQRVLRVQATQAEEQLAQCAEDGRVVAEFRAAEAKRQAESSCRAR
jgi:hypothetical protein